MNTNESEPDRGRLQRIAQQGARTMRWAHKGLVRRPREILVETAWRLGDEIMTLPLFPVLRARFPQDRIGVITNYPELFADSPHIDAVNPTWSRVDWHLLLRGAPRNKYRLRHLARCANIAEPTAPPDLCHWSLPPAPPGPYIAIAAGASWATKRWTHKNWRELAMQLQRRGYNIVELGLKGEAVGVGRDETGNRPLREAARWLRGADVLICLDSGLMHLALALDTTVLALFGPTDPKLYVRNHPRFHVMDNRRPCRGCWNRGKMKSPGICPLSRSDCLDTISPDAVLRRVETFLPRQVKQCVSSF